uniref:Uncharacterized protein n=1 Tax=Chromera velia CCMP2878 TaxID=1169474 RepID=A0A0G4H185_9ALVE|eukprot:Cvel_24269.t1-p1 / transcript=Cvel_24269.t1 / gene=Cvel_24269 / organism=Chromera_velia_CCMP2878 / gene_product=hypothetical protein / transcript_product=hypothetical protein / location=Cvel_scaffold2602:12073-16435(+) / protein_length=522 / sequence_SO=supercontig / SO=protein_coding / is_pseudo=false
MKPENLVRLYKFCVRAGEAWSRAKEPTRASKLLGFALVVWSERSEEMSQDGSFSSEEKTAEQQKDDPALALTTLQVAQEALSDQGEGESEISDKGESESMTAKVLRARALAHNRLGNSSHALVELRTALAVLKQANRADGSSFAHCLYTSLEIQMAFLASRGGIVFGLQGSQRCGQTSVECRLYRFTCNGPGQIDEGFHQVKFSWLMASSARLRLAELADDLNSVEMLLEDAQNARRALWASLLSKFPSSNYDDILLKAFSDEFNPPVNEISQDRAFAMLCILEYQARVIKWVVNKKAKAWSKDEETAYLSSLAEFVKELIKAEISSKCFQIMVSFTFERAGAGGPAAQSSKGIMQVCINHLYKLSMESHPPDYSTAGKARPCSVIVLLSSYVALQDLRVFSSRVVHSPHFVHVAALCVRELIQMSEVKEKTVPFFEDVCKRLPVIASQKKGPEDGWPDIEVAKAWYNGQQFYKMNNFEAAEPWISRALLLLEYTATSGAEKHKDMIQGFYEKCLQKLRTAA